MILSNKTAWLLHDLVCRRLGPDADSCCSEPHCMYIQDVIDLQTCRFFVADGQHFIACTIDGTAFSSCMGKYDLASMELKGMLVQVTEHRFIVDGGAQFELAVNACACIGEGSLSGETVDINELVCVEKPDSTAPYRIDFERVAAVVNCPLFCYVRGRLAEDCDLNVAISCAGKPIGTSTDPGPEQPACAESDGVFAVFKGRVWSKLPNLAPSGLGRKVKEKNAPKEQDLNTSQPSNKYHSVPAADEMCRLSLEEIDREISFEEEIESSIVFDDSEDDLLACKRGKHKGPYAVNSPVYTAAIHMNRDKLASSRPKSSVPSIGPAAIDTIRYNRPGLDLDKAFLEKLATAGAVSVTVPGRDAPEDGVGPLCSPPDSPKENGGVISDSKTKQIRPGCVIVLKMRSRKMEIKLPLRHVGTDEAHPHAGPAGILRWDGSACGRFFVMDDFYMEIAGDCAEVAVGDYALLDGSKMSCRHTPDIMHGIGMVGAAGCDSPVPCSIAAVLSHLVDNSADIGRMGWIEEECEGPQKEKPVIIKLCKGPYEPAGDPYGQKAQSSRKRRLHTKVRLTPSIAYYASGVQARMLFSRNRTGALIFQPPVNSEDATLGSNPLLARYIQPNRKDVSFIKHGNANAVFRGHETPSIRFIRCYTHNLTGHPRPAEAVSSPRLNFVAGSAKYQLRRVSGRARPCLLL